MQKKKEHTDFIEYSSDDLYDFIEGATFLATGGGGPKEVAKNLLANSGVDSVKVAGASSAPDDMQIAMVAQVFAPSDIWDNQDYLSALNSFKTLLPGSDSRGVLPVEVGSVNGIVPAIVASLTDSFLIVDTQIDRSMSEMDMGLFQNHVPFKKLQMVSSDGAVSRQDTYSSADSDAMVVEHDILDIMHNNPQFKGVGGFATYPMSGLELRDCYKNGYLIGDTFDYARKLGACMKDTDFETRILNAIQEHLGSAYRPYPLFSGYLVEARQQAADQDYGYADFISDDPASCSGARVYYSNENMIAYRLIWVLVRGVLTPVELGPMAIGPDALCYLLLEGQSQNYEKGHSFSNEAFGEKHGDPEFFKRNRIEIIGIPEPKLRNQAIIDSFTREIRRAKEAFGGTYDGQYIPIEKLQALQPAFEITEGGRKESENAGIVLTAPAPDFEIRYTLDGSEPGKDAILYQKPILLAQVAGRELKTGLFHKEDVAGISVSAGFPSL